MLQQHPNHLTVQWSQTDHSDYHWLWLRDKCQCPKCFNANSRQKYFDSSVLPLDTKPTTVENDGETLTLTWLDGHVTAYDLSWLKARDYSDGRPAGGDDARPTPSIWETPRLPPGAQFDCREVLDSEQTMGEALETLLRLGIVVLKARDGEKTPFEQLMERICGFLQPTYFGTYFDLNVKPEETTDSVAFSTRALPLHTDIPYYSPPPDFQFLNGLDVSPLCLERGVGNTRFVDGLTAATTFRAEYPDLFDVLTRVPVINRAEYPLAGKIYENVVPIIMLSADGSIDRILNNPSKMFFDNVEYGDMYSLYQAYKTFKDWLTQNGPSYSHSWSDGDLVIWDNRRVLHGRGEFGSQGIKRILRGGYIGENELVARLRYIRSRFAPDANLRPHN